MAGSIEDVVVEKGIVGEDAVAEELIVDDELKTKIRDIWG